ncbi:MAG: hypothetical protein Q7T74_06785 [Candidatus Saccharibacteria bacterium]|nr:hypothetical protein [Candidatus Saccharibacteria bacterium]
MNEFDTEPNVTAGRLVFARKAGVAVVRATSGPPVEFPELLTGTEKAELEAALAGITRAQQIAAVTGGLRVVGVRS